MTNEYSETTDAGPLSKALEERAAYKARAAALEADVDSLKRACAAYEAALAAYRELLKSQLEALVLAHEADR